MQKYDIAAYIWPSYTGSEKRSRIFWEKGIGEWQSVQSAESRVPGQKLPRIPLWGYQDEADPAVMEFQIGEALRHGVNVFIYDWYWYDRRPFLEQCLDNGFLGAKNNGDMRFYLMWANHDATYLWDKRNTELSEVMWYGSQPREEFDRVCDRVIELYFKKANYYKIDGCPVFMIYDVCNLIRGLGGIENAKAAIASFRQRVRSAGFPDLHLQLTIWSEGAVNLSGVDSTRTGSTRDIVPELGFDSMSHYQFVHFVNCDRTYAEVLPDVRREWERIDREYRVPYFPHVTIGWDNNPRYTRLVGPILRDNTPERFEKGLRMAKEYVDTHTLPAPLITINSWNEWTEMSYLEPDDVYGYGYLEAIRRVFCE